MTRGRPLTTDGRRASFTARLSEAEAEAAEKVIEASGQSRSEWVRNLIVAASSPEPARAVRAVQSRPSLRSSDPCIHRVPAGAYCKRCVAANGG